MECGGECVCVINCVVWVAGDYGDDLCRDSTSYVEEWGGVLDAVYDVR